MMDRKEEAQFMRALAILHRFGTEYTGWRSFFRRWYYSDEPLRNDAANLVREAEFSMAQPDNTRLVGDAPPRRPTYSKRTCAPRGR